MFNELFLQKIWFLQYFNKNDLKTECGKTLQIVFPGNANLNAGPDFLNARIQLNEIEWAGNIEIHLKTSDWFKHAHQHDKHYSNVILHVVYLNDRYDFYQSPVLTLKNRMIHLKKDLLNEIIRSKYSIACFPFFKKRYLTEEIKKHLLQSRFERKCAEIIDLLKFTHYDWEQVIWILFCKNMGHHVNENAFKNIALNLPYNIIQKYETDPILLQSLIFGMAGLLDKEFIDIYPEQLKTHFQRLKIFHALKSSLTDVFFLRMRPMNFPTIRLAQLSALLTSHIGILNTFLIEDDLHHLRSYFKVQLNDYWENHFVFDKISARSSKMIGEDLINNILINTIIPLKITRSYVRLGKIDFSIVFSLLNQIKPESNRIFQYFSENEKLVESAADSQAMIELYNSFCSQKKCEECLVAYEMSQNN